YLREGSVPTLEMQILVPIQEHNEFNHNIVDIAEELAKDSSYQQMARAAYGRDFDYYVLTRAIANFERTILSGNSRYDQQFLQGKKNVLTSRELAGKALFFSEKTGCYHCHSGFDFSNYAFENNGLYNQYQDIGRMRVTGDSVDLALFKVPSLRNVGETAPYMHDGSIATLEEVIAHYNNGGENHPQKSNQIKSLHLSVEEKENIILFLHTLTDWSLTTNPDYDEN
ncbi:MAG: c-type cytochrome, partial [Saprospiraceae bacterium]|nr:c-type cytochrome [Saprospiraceae bacterium]